MTNGRARIAWVNATAIQIFENFQMGFGLPIGLQDLGNTHQEVSTFNGAKGADKVEYRATVKVTYPMIRRAKSTALAMYLKS